jgi:hypothetical protein
MQPFIHGFGVLLTNKRSELLRSYLEFGLLFLPLTSSLIHALRAGEYIFDFAVVIFGVRPCTRLLLLSNSHHPQRSSFFERQR